MARAKVEKNESIDLDSIEKKLKIYVQDEIKDELDKSYKRLIREKSKKILFRNVIILVLIFVIMILIYLLNSVDYFDKFFIDTINKEEVVDERNASPTLEELKNKYGYLIDKIYINEQSDYINDYYSGNLSLELKNLIALNNINLDSFKEDDYTLIDDNVLKISYEDTFRDKYISNSFVYNGIGVKYISKLNSYISDKILEKIDTNIKREIIDISIDKNVYITTIEGVVKDEKVYNIPNLEEIGTYDGSLISYQDNLIKLVYEFNNNKLVSISVK